MPRYLSTAWFDEVNAAARQSPQARAATTGAHLTLQQVVTEGPEGDVRYWVRVEDGTLEAGLGEAALSDATLTQSYETAVAIATGELSAQSAFMAGAVRLSGNMAALVRHQDALRALEAVFTQVRERTLFVPA